MSYKAQNYMVSLIAASVDLNTVSAVTVGVVPPGVSFVCTGAFVLSKTYTAASSSQISIGTSGGSFVDIVNIVTLNTFTATNQTRALTVVSLAPSITAGTTISVNVTPGGSPPGPFTAQVTLLGYYF